MKNLWKRLWQEEEGQDLVEYGLLLVLVSLGAVAAMGTLASAISNAFRQRPKNLTKQLAKRNQTRLLWAVIVT